MTQLRSSQNFAAILKISCVFEWRRLLSHSQSSTFWSAEAALLLVSTLSAQEAGPTSGPISFPRAFVNLDKDNESSVCVAVPSPEDKPGNGREGGNVYERSEIGSGPV